MFLVIDYSGNRKLLTNTEGNLIQIKSEKNQKRN